MICFSKKSRLIVISRPVISGGREFRTVDVRRVFHARLMGDMELQQRMRSNAVLHNIFRLSTAIETSEQFTMD
jgi:hypothetical protein